MQMSYTEIIGMIREKLPKVELRELDWGFEDMQNFILEFAKIKKVEDKLNDENRQKIMEIELITQELQTSRSDLFVKKVESEVSVQSVERKEKRQDQKKEGSFRIALEQEDLGRNYVLKRKADSFIKQEEEEVDEGEGGDTTDLTKDFEHISKTSSPNKRVKLSDQNTTVELPGHGLDVDVPSVMNPNDPMWIKAYEDFKEIKSEIVDTMTSYQQEFREALIAWMEESRKI